MSDKHPIDDLFRSKLEQHATEPPMHLWAEIEKKRKRRFLFFKTSNGRSALLTTLLMGSAALLAFWMLRTPAMVELGSFPLHLTENAASEKVSTPATAVASETATLVNPLVQAAVAAVQTPLFPKLQQLKKNLYNQQLVQSLFHKKYQPITPPTMRLSQQETVVQDELVLSEATEPTTDSAEEAETIAGTAGIYGRKRFVPLPTLDKDIAPIETNLFTPDPKCAAFRNNKPRLYMELYAGPEITMREFTAEDSEYRIYAAAREQTESARFAFSTGVRLSAVTDFGVALRSGINLTQINEVFDYLNENEQRTIITDIFGPDGQIVRTDTVFISGTHHKTVNNRYRTVDIPIILGYEFKYQNFTFAINGGAYLNLNFQQRGEFLSPNELQPVSFDSNAPGTYQAFKDRLEVGWYGSLGVHYQVSPRTHILFEPSFRIYPNSITQETYVLNQRYFLSGLALGVRHAL